MKVTIAAMAAAVSMAAAVVLGSHNARASAFDAEYVFGDSLSDRGNLAETGFVQHAVFGANAPVTNYPNPPSFHDSFTNGPVAVQLLANSYGLNADPSLWVTGFKDVNNLFGGAAYTPGTNYAVAGATSAPAAVGGPAGINLPQQVAAYGAFVGLKADPNALYVVMIGGNDVRNAALQGTGAAAITTGVTAETTAITTLAGEGARNFLVVNVPNVGIIPEFAQDTPAAAAAATTDSQLYDSQLLTGLAGLAVPSGTHVSEFDLYGFNNGVVANAAALGFTDTTDRCYTATPISSATSTQCGVGAANINSFVYWDSIHPTARVQALWSQGMSTAVPEPSGLAVLGVGVAALALLRRRRV